MSTDETVPYTTRATERMGLYIVIDRIYTGDVLRRYTPCVWDPVTVVIDPRHVSLSDSFNHCLIPDARHAH